MDRLDLFKLGNRNLNSAAKVRRNLQANQERRIKRSTLFSSGRNIEIRPPTLELGRNIKGDLLQENANPSGASPKKLTKQEAYLKRYLEWKAEKQKKINEQKQNRSKPFLPVVKSFAPKGHQFVPPVGLKSHQLQQTRGEEKKDKNKEIHKKNFVCLKNTSSIDLKAKTSQSVQNAKQKSDMFLKPKLEKKIAVRNGNLEKKCIPPTIKLEKNNLYTNTVLKTPLEKENFCNPFSTIVTSTVRKTKTEDLESEEFFENIISPIEIENLMPNQDDKIDYIRTSNNKKNVFEENKAPQPLTALEKQSHLNVSIKSDNVTEPVTPTQQEVKLINHISPYVSISRGKCSLKKEIEKRESIYKLEILEPKDSVEIKRKCESVKYFRKILEDEVQRLLSLCESWEQYKNENEDYLKDGGSDMINATIGQTRLLTSKKMEQFRGLIDRCNENISRNSSDNITQTVNPEDLEGFWSMIQIQVDNLDNRFEKLEKWKQSNWNDPDEEKTPRKNLAFKTKIIKKRKPKEVKSNDALKELLKKAQAAYKQSKKNKQSNDIDLILVKPKRYSTGGNTSSTNTPCKLLRQIATPQFPNLGKIPVKDEWISSAALPCMPSENSAFNNNEGMKYLNTPNKKVPLKTLRKSMLKTPGTAKKNKKVIFNETVEYSSSKVIYPRS